MFSKSSFNFIRNMCTNSLVNIKQFLETTEIQFIYSLFKKNGFDLKIAGGAVRDLLSGIIPNDVDFATQATPDQMLSFLKDVSNIRIVTTAAGEKHGTIGTFINRNKMYEITTLRIDKITDGRRAEVEFIEDWKLDASRRDFTINAMFMDIDGTITDFFNGQEDLKNGRVRFVGNSVERIREDYLRILRYFRFFTRFGKHEHEKSTIESIAQNLEGLHNISGERIWSELKKIFLHKHCDRVIPIMFNDLKFGKYCGFGDAEIDIEYFQKIYRNIFSCQVSFEPITLLSSLISNDKQLLKLLFRLKFSNLEKEIALYIITNRELMQDPNITLLQKQLFLESKPDQTNLRKYIIEFIKYKGFNQILDEFSNWEIPILPLKANIIMSKVNNKRLISPALNECKKVWFDSQFEMTEGELIEALDGIIKQLNNNLENVYRSRSN